MSTLRTILFILIIKIFCFLNYINTNEVLGCGGFIKSHADIDFSKVEIKLLTKHGSLKDKTDCSPSNGYYFLPIYDKGSYLLSISPPPGWSFDPQQVELNFDGKTDICSQGKDVNFIFKGFGITGKVSLTGTDNSGARGVSVKLESGDKTDVRHTTTDINGIFSFTPIVPGEYIITATHSKWHFSKNKHTVVVVSGNTELPKNSLVVSGFDVTGYFDGSDQLSMDITMALFNRKGQTLPTKCTMQNKQSILQNNLSYEKESICLAKVEASGEYKFIGVPPGKYLVQPVLSNLNLKLHIKPNILEFEVLKDSLEIKEHFEITGFSVIGKVLAEKEKPVSGATIKLNENIITKTDADGNYILDNIKSATYTIQVEAPKMHFDKQQMKIHMSTPTLPDIIATSFEVCGKVVSESSYVVGITKQGSTFHTTSSSKPKSGDWCTYLPKGKFNVEVLTTDADKQNGVQFFPVQQTIAVNSDPISGITFSQLRATLNGDVKCLPDSPTSCTETEVTLQSLDNLGQKIGQKQITKAQNGQYAFKDILPGPYEITIPQSNMCYESTRVLINVASASEVAPSFIQTGYEVSIIASHRGMLKYSHIGHQDTTTNSQTQTTNNLKLVTGVNTFCVSKYGTYRIWVESCHLYDENLPKSFTTNDAPILITAIAHKVGIRVLSTESTAESLQLEVESSSLGKELIQPKAELHKVDGKFAYRYETHLRPEEVLRITPKSDTLLFTPHSKDIIGPNDCIDIAFNFVATRGLILRGKVVPAIKDVKITLDFPQNPDINNQIMFTSITGEFKFGPIDENLAYNLNAEKESYVFSDYKRDSSSFQAHKLCEIIVKVKDETGNNLSGVLLSLSGAESYRKNLVTGIDGSINFHSLSPSNYFLRPMMKEYKFEPNSKIIEIKDGETIEVELVGKRVAFSVFGKITSLNGDPYGQVNVEATADETCMNYQEEATSENNGQYRLRGLQPGCTYTIRTKVGSNINANVERSIPPSRTVKVTNEDINDVNLIAVSVSNFVDVTARITATSNDHYKTLWVEMFKKSAPDSPVYLQRLNLDSLYTKSRYNPGVMVFFPRIPLDHKNYIVRLKSTLSDKTYSFTLPSEEFIANTSSVFVELDFKPEVRTAETELNQNSISALVLVALVAIAFFKQDIAMDFLNFIWGKVGVAVKDVVQKQAHLIKKDVRKTEPLNQKEIDHLADHINASKKKKSKKV
ncbi:nodal modulator 1 [Teleopsis dalmanni]|uniref:nodal modulator 1 n=1 Tax=Teleopsis dalmanni TaxID=139649 RepID=UPI0018CEC41A|nr:nodal modulator 1 [Teleopsis dalmanni]